jgi:hypothetical protein
MATASSFSSYQIPKKQIRAIDSSDSKLGVNILNGYSWLNFTKI